MYKIILGLSLMTGVSAFVLGWIAVAMFIEGRFPGYGFLTVVVTPILLLIAYLIGGTMTREK